MKVIVSNVTGSQVREALLDKDSGVIEYKCGEISHILWEKQKGCNVVVVKELKKNDSKPATEEKVSEDTPEPTLEDKSSKRPVSKNKRK